MLACVLLKPFLAETAKIIKDDSSKHRLFRQVHALTQAHKHMALSDTMYCDCCRALVERQGSSKHIENRPWNLKACTSICICGVFVADLKEHGEGCEKYHEFCGLLVPWCLLGGPFGSFDCTIVEFLLWFWLCVRGFFLYKLISTICWGLWSPNLALFFLRIYLILSYVNSWSNI